MKKHKIYEVLVSKMPALIIFLLLTPPVFAKKLDLSQHTMTMGGQAQMTYDTSNITKFGSVAADVNISYGYFVLDNFLLGLNLEVGALFTIAPEVRAALGPHVLYAFNTKSIAYPYVELGASITFKHQGEQRWGVGLKPALGVLLEINKYVAVDLGLSSKIDMPIAGNVALKQTTFKAALGHLGIRVFF